MSLLARVSREIGRGTGQAREVVAPSTFRVPAEVYDKGLSVLPAEEAEAHINRQAQHLHCGCKPDVIL